MILVYRKSGVLQAVSIVRDLPKATIVKLAGEPHRNLLRVPKSSPDMQLFASVDDALDYVGHPELKGK